MRCCALLPVSAAVTSPTTSFAVSIQTAPPNPPSFGLTHHPPGCVMTWRARPQPCAVLLRARGARWQCCAPLPQQQRQRALRQRPNWRGCVLVFGACVGSSRCQPACHACAHVLSQSVSVIPQPAHASPTRTPNTHTHAQHTHPTHTHARPTHTHNTPHQVKREMARKSQELPHESLSTMLADYGPGAHAAAASIINTPAYYHPNPVRRIDLELPPSAASLRRSIEAQARVEVAAGARGGGGARGAAAGGGGGGGGEGDGSSGFGDLLGSSGSAVDLLESLLQHGHAGGGRAGHGAAAAGGRGEAGAGGGAVGRSASVPAAGWLGLLLPPGGAAGVPSVNLRGSMLAAESTFIFPGGLQPAASGAATDGAETGGSGELGGSSSVAIGGGWDSSWRQGGQQEQQQQCEGLDGMPTTRTTSAPGYLASRAGEAA